jgi:four helix bundle protein
VLVLALPLRAAPIVLAAYAMAGVRRFQDLDCWQLAMELADRVFAVTENGRAADDGDFCDQIRRASDRIAPQIAEGWGRFTPAQTAHYLRMARGSLAEVQSHLEKARRRQYFTSEQQDCLDTLAARTAGAVTAFIKDRVAKQRESRTSKSRATRHRAQPGSSRT